MTFKKGKSGNLKGRPKVTLKMREIQHLTRHQIEEIGSLILNGNVAKLQQIAQDPTSPALKVWMATGSIQGIKKGDLNAMNAFLDRIVGRIPAPVEHSGPDGGPIEVDETKTITVVTHWGDETDASQSQDAVKNASTKKT
jgi:hypothetical protein